MAKYLTISEAQAKLPELPSELTDDLAIVTNHGQPVMAVISYEKLTSLLETLDILSDSEFANRLKESIVQAERGETICWEEAKRKLGL